LPPDRFYGKDFTFAAEEYLRMVGHAATFDDIYTALERGGLRLENGSKKAANISMTRAVRKFVKFKSGDSESFGLVEWYPKKRKIREGKESNGQEPPKAEGVLPQLEMECSAV
jgi:hypothetical protein